MVPIHLSGVFEKKLNGNRYFLLMFKKTFCVWWISASTQYNRVATRKTIDHQKYLDPNNVKVNQLFLLKYLHIPKYLKLLTDYWVDVYKRKVEHRVENSFFLPIVKALCELFSHALYSISETTIYTAKQSWNVDERINW